MLSLRPYQRDAIDSLYSFWSGNPGGSPLLVVATGGGKSLIIAKTIEEFLEIEPTTRIVQVTHVRELIEQNYKELLGVMPFAPAGVFSASLGRRDAHAQVLFAGIQTAYTKAARIGHVDVLFVDEAHLIPPDSSTMYGQFIADLRAINPNMLVVGLTATPFRMDQGRLDEGDDRLFDAITYEVGIRDLIEAGFLCPLISKATSTVLNVKGVARTKGDFVGSALQKAVDKHPITAAAVDEIMQFGLSPEAPRRAWLAFCAGVEHAHHVAEEFRARGIAAEAVDGGMKRAERDRIIGDFRAGKLKALTNANVLTTGFNVPHVDLLALLRPTLSTSLYVQMVGRGTRCVGPDIAASAANGKENCLVLDFAGNVRRHGPVDAVNVKAPGKGTGEAPVKECPNCHSIILAGARECKDCGHIFERDVEKKITASAGAAPILSKGGPEFVKVEGRTFFRHEKQGGKASIRVNYRTSSATVHREWICPEHDGGARSRFEKWWRFHGGAEPLPATIDETLDRIEAKEIREVSEIRIRPSGSFWEVCGHKLVVKPLPWEQPESLEVAMEVTLPADASGAQIAEAFANLRFPGARL